MTLPDRGPTELARDPGKGDPIPASAPPEMSPIFSLNGKVIVVTGGAQGMGRAHVDMCVQLGARVALLDVQDDLGQAAIELHGGRVIYIRTDVTSEAAWSHAIDTTLSAFGRLDGLVNNAGILVAKSMRETSVTDFQRVVDVNQQGVFLGMRTIAPHLEANGGGSIVNISSTAGLVGIGECFAYSASKFAVRGMTKAAAVELAPARIRVNSIHPGDTHTPMIEDLGASEAVPDVSTIPLARFAMPQEIATAVCFLLSSASSYMTGAELVLDGGYTAR